MVSSGLCGASRWHQIFGIQRIASECSSNQSIPNTVDGLFAACRKPNFCALGIANMCSVKANAEVWGLANSKQDIHITRHAMNTKQSTRLTSISQGANFKHLRVTLGSLNIYHNSSLKIIAL